MGYTCYVRKPSKTKGKSDPSSSPCNYPNAIDAEGINIQLFHTFASLLSRQIWVSPRLTELWALSSRSKCVEVSLDSDLGSWFIHGFTNLS